MTKILADGGGEGTRDIEKAVHLEGLREHADVLCWKPTMQIRRVVMSKRKLSMLISE